MNYDERMIHRLQAGGTDVVAKARPADSLEPHYMGAIPVSQNYVYVHNIGGDGESNTVEESRVRGLLLRSEPDVEIVPRERTPLSA